MKIKFLFLVFFSSLALAGCSLEYNYAVFQCTPERGQKDERRKPILEGAVSRWNPYEAGRIRNVIDSLFHE